MKLEMLFLNFCLRCAFALVGAIWVVGVHAQVRDVHFDTGVSMHNLDATELENFQELSWGPLLRFGLAFAENERGNLKGHSEFRMNRRSFKRDFGTEKFAYRITAIELPIYSAWNFWKDLHVHAGVNPVVYVLNLHSDPDNTAETKTSDDFRNFDVALILGLTYRLGDLISIGGRCDWGIIPLVKFTPISDFGEMGNSHTDLLYRRAEIFVRWHLR